MYGYFNNIIKTLIVERFGQQQWDAVVKKCKISKGFKENVVYDDNVTMRLIEAASEVLHESIDDLLETIGEFYLHQLRVSGHDLVFKTLGENLYQFLDNLDYVHACMKESYPEMKAPSFRCDPASTDGNIVLHYYSVRRGFYRMVLGLVRAIAGIYFQSEVTVKVKSVGVEQFGQKFMREHVVFDISMRSDSAVEGLVPPTFIAQTRRHSERQILKEDVDKVRAKLEIIKKEFGEAFLPLNQDQVQQAKWKAIVNVRNMYKGFSASYPNRFHMNAFIFCHTFPFHFVFDDKMKIVQSGVQLQKLIPALRTETASVNQCFTLIYPTMMDLTYVNVQKLIVSPFIVQARTEAMHEHYDKNLQLRLRGQMIPIDMLGSVMFLCSPYVTSLKDLEDRAMHMADIPVHDVTRSMLLNSMFAKTDVKSEKPDPKPEQPKPVDNGKNVVVIRERANYLKGLDYNDTDSLRNALFEALAELERQRSINDEMIGRLVPKPWVERVRKGEAPIAGEFKNVSILFCDLVMFTQMVNKCKPADTVTMLNNLQTKFDRLLAVHGVERVMSIGDAYVVSCGLPEPCASHLERVANAALAMLVAASEVRSPFNYGARQGRHCKVRIGVHTGPVKAGIVGSRIPNLYLMGPTVTMASRLESHGVPDHVQVSPEVYKHLRSKDYTLEKRGDVEIRGYGKTTTYLLMKNDSVSVDELMGRAPARGASHEAIQVKVTGDDSRASSGGSSRSNRIHPARVNGDVRR